MEIESYDVDEEVSDTFIQITARAFDTPCLFHIAFLKNVATIQNFQIGV